MLNSVLLFFDVSGGEIMLIMLFILMFFGSKKIPELARGLGKTMREFQNASNGLKQELLSETHKLREEVSTLRQDLQQKAGLDKIAEDFKTLNENVSKETNLDQVNSITKELTINEDESTQPKLSNSIAFNNSSADAPASAVDSDKNKTTDS